MSFRLRAYRDDDLDCVVAAFTESVHELAAPYYDAAQRAAWAPAEPDLPAWRARLAGVDVLVAEDDAGVLGFIGHDDDGYVALLYTASRAARRGVASRLYARVESGWRARGVARAFAEVSLAARPFFDRQGFDVIDRERVERRGLIFERFKMAKALTMQR